MGINKLKFSLAILFILGGLIFFLIENKKVENKSLNIEIKGLIKEISYNEKGFPSLIINDNYYNLSCCNNKQLRIGDSIVKYKNSNVVYQYRENFNIHSFECGLSEE